MWSRLTHYDFETAAKEGVKRLNRTQVLILKTDDSFDRSERIIISEKLTRVNQVRLQIICLQF